MADTAKIIKPGGKAPDDLEKQVSSALADLEATSDIKAQLRELFFVGAKEVEIANKKSILIYVPVPQLKQYQKVQARLVRELEKKFSGKHVVFIARRRILPKPKRGKNRKPEKQKRPRR
uniref:40S ribosomal protein S7 n=2 Tax=Plectus sambesii TaxID=2011161 RepID=A0A914XS77_9BILA